MTRGHFPEEGWVGYDLAKGWGGRGCTIHSLKKMFWDETREGDAV